MKSAVSKVPRIVLLVLSGMLANAVIACAQTPPVPGVVPIAIRGQPAISFDQIDRIMIQGAVPPAINSFAADAATIGSLEPLKADANGVKGEVARSAATMLVSGALSYIPIAGPFIAKSSSRAINAAEQAAEKRESEKHSAAVVHFVNAGALSSFAFYHGWLRCERGGRELTIVKPEEGITAVLNLTNKTVRIIDAQTSPETIVVDTVEELPPTLVGEPVTERLPDRIVAGLPARGYLTTATLELKQAMIWCAPGRHTVKQVEYVTDLPDPQPDQYAPAALTLAEGCSPISTASYREPTRLVLYRATSIDPGTTKGVSLVFERANVQALDEHSVSLFSIPADFTKEQ